MSVKIGTISGPFVGSAQRQSTAVRAARWLSRFQQDSQQLDAVASEAAESLHPGPVTVVCLSDTHNTNPTSVPDGDILLHAGDLSQYGTFAELQAQLAWLQSQPHPHKVVIAGNHDLILDTAFVAAHPDRELDLAGRRRSDLDRGDVLYLEYEAVDLEIKGKDRSVRIFGSPWTPRFGSFAFQYGDGEATWTNAVPDGTDILLTHGPPKGYLDDGGKGCPSLLAELWRSRPKLVVCGHIHAGRGEEWLRFDWAQAYYENVLLGRRPWMSVVALGFCLVFCRVWRLITKVTARAGAESQGRTATRLVNAAIVGGRGNTERREAVGLYL